MREQWNIQSNCNGSILKQVQTDCNKGHSKDSRLRVVTTRKGSRSGTKHFQIVTQIFELLNKKATTSYRHTGEVTLWMNGKMLHFRCSKPIQLKLVQSVSVLHLKKVPEPEVSDPAPLNRIYKGLNITDCY